MTAREAFEYLLARVRVIQEIPLAGSTRAEREEEAALLVAPGAISFQSMCGPHEGFILEERVPLCRGEAA